MTCPFRTFFLAIVGLTSTLLIAPVASTGQLDPALERIENRFFEYIRSSSLKQKPYRGKGLTVASEDCSKFDSAVSDAISAYLMPMLHFREGGSGLNSYAIDARIQLLVSRIEVIDTLRSLVPISRRGNELLLKFLERFRPTSSHGSNWLLSSTPDYIRLANHFLALLNQDYISLDDDSRARFDIVRDRLRPFSFGKLHPCYLFAPNVSDPKCTTLRDNFEVNHLGHLLTIPEPEEIETAQASQPPTLSCGNSDVILNTVRIAAEKGDFFVVKALVPFLPEFPGRIVAGSMVEHFQFVAGTISSFGGIHWTHVPGASGLIRDISQFTRVEGFFKPTEIARIRSVAEKLREIDRQTIFLCDLSKADGEKQRRRSQICLDEYRRRGNELADGEIELPSPL